MGFNDFDFHSDAREGNGIPERIPRCFTPEALEACKNQYMLQQVLGNVGDRAILISWWPPLEGIMGERTGPRVSVEPVVRRRFTPEVAFDDSLVLMSTGGWKTGPPWQRARLCQDDLGSAV